MLIENTHSLDPLLDSCVASWTRRFSLLDVRFDHHYKRRSASGSLPTFFKFSGQNQFLHAKGILIGTVTQCAKAYSSNSQWIHSSVFELSSHIQNAFKTFDVSKGCLNSFINVCAGLSENPEAHLFVLEALFKQFKEAGDLSMCEEPDVLNFLQDVHREQNIFSFSYHPSHLLQKRKGLEQVRDGYGIGTNGIQQNDLLVILLGCSAPLVLRPREGHYVLVGKAIVSGYMDGEGVQGIEVKEDMDGNKSFIRAEDFVCARTGLIAYFHVVYYALQFYRHIKISSQRNSF